MTHAGGRPTKYDPSFIAVAEEYMESCGGEQMELPTIEGLAIRIGVDDETLLEWAKRYVGFSAALKEIRHRQKNQLINDGMYGGKEVNATMAIFLLKANHKMVETTHTDITSNGQTLPPLVVIDTNEKDTS
jgi:DNA-packaging protein gp3